MSTRKQLEHAKHGFETVGWWRSDSAGLPSAWVSVDDDSGECVNCLWTAVCDWPPAVDLVKRVLGVASNDAIWSANDSQPATHEGRLWAIGIIDQALTLLDADERKET